MISKNEFLERWSQLHSGSPVAGIVGAWLSISYRCGLIATLLRLTPNALTLLGLLAAVATAYWALSLWAIALLVFSLFCDGIDGSVAIFQKKESNRGAIFDSVADRIRSIMARSSISNRRTCLDNHCALGYCQHSRICTGTPFIS